MAKNKFISYIIILCKITIGIMSTLSLLLFVISIHAEYYPYFYEDFVIYVTQLPLNVIVYTCDNCEGNNQVLLFSDMELWVKLWMSFRLAVATTFSNLMLTRIIKICRSVKSFNTFYFENIKTFRHIAYCCFALFLMTTINISPDEFQNPKFVYSIELSWLFGALLSMSLAEVFNEGHQLQQDKESII